MEWSKNQTLDLIKLMHAHECLWNVRNEDYKDRKKKRDSVEAIARRMDISHSDIEKKIINLKNQYNREINKIKTKSKCGTDDVYVSNWYAFKPLSFLSNPYLPSKSMSTDSTIEEEIYDEGVNSHDFTLIEEQFMENTSWAPEISHINGENNHYAKRSKLDQQIETLTMLTQARNNIYPKDEFDVFGEYVASELRGIIGEKNVLDTKKQIQDLIYYKKLEQINLTASTDQDTYKDKDIPSNEDVIKSSVPNTVLQMCKTVKNEIDHM